MDFEAIKEDFPKYEKLQKYTSIKLECGTSVTDTISDIQQRLAENLKFVPPLFSEYVIEKTDISNLVECFRNEVVRAYPQIDDEERDKKIQEVYEKYMKSFPNTGVTKYLVRWQDEVTFTVLIYVDGKKKMYIKNRYDFNERNLSQISIQAKILSADVKAEFDEKEEEEGKRLFIDFCKKETISVLAITEFVLDYTNKIQYEKIEYIPNTTYNSTHSAHSNKSKNKTRNSSIVLKSKKKQYIITLDDVSAYKNRKYRKIKNSWFVRGYYERYGKEKKLKYIPPRINHRNPEKLTETKSKKYVIKD